MSDTDPGLTRAQHEQFDAKVDPDELREQLAGVSDVNNMGSEPGVPSVADRLEELDDSRSTSAATWSRSGGTTRSLSEQPTKS